MQAKLTKQRDSPYLISRRPGALTNVSNANSSELHSVYMVLTDRSQDVMIDDKLDLIVVSEAQTNRNTVEIHF